MVVLQMRRKVFIRTLLKTFKNILELSMQSIVPNYSGIKSNTKIKHVGFRHTFYPTDLCWLKTSLLHCTKAYQHFRSVI